MSVDPAPLQVGMAVVDARMAPVGLVKAVRETDFLLDRELQRDVYLPRDLIRGVSGPTVVLALLASEIDHIKWPHPHV